jgi:peptidoglycan/xylan/chitin deacetylase (PgdA/CDA1 family)
VRGGDAGPPNVIIPEQRKDTALILAYHRIADLAHDEAGLCVRPETFRAQMRHVREHYHPLPLAELAAAAAAGDLPPGSVALTFDDGYRDALSTAAAVLRELGIPATFFVTAGTLDAETELWWDIRTRVFRETVDLPPYLEITLGGVRRCLPVRSGAALQQLHAHMTSATGEEQLRIRRELAEWSGLELMPRPTHRLLRADEIVRLNSYPGFSIGAHTLCHRSLPGCPPDEARHEIAASRARLEQLLGRPVTEFCYPYGEYTTAVTDMVAASGYTLAVTVEDRAVAPGELPFLLPRCEITEQSLTEFSRRLVRRLAGE